MKTKEAPTRGAGFASEDILGSERRWLGWLIATLCLVGVVMSVAASYMGDISSHTSIASASAHEMLWLVLGLGAFFVLRAIPLKVLLRFAPLFLGGCLLALVAVLDNSLGSSVGGSSRWFGFGSIQIQPSEIVKFALVLSFTALIEARRGRRTRDIVTPVLAITGLVAALVFIEPDMGTAIIVCAIGFAALIIAEVPMGVLALVGLSGTCVGIIGAFSSSYRRLRLLSFLHPWLYRASFSYQEVQALGSFASGGFWGTGLGSGIANWGYLPNAQTDFIFAVIGQDFGLIGALVVLALEIALVVVLLRAVQSLAGPERTAVFLVAVWIAVQTILNVGAVVGALPVTGVPLPLVSEGGSSLIMTLAALGLVSRAMGRRRAADEPAASSRY